MNRLLGVKESGEQNTLMYLIGGLHGNEGTGITAIINIFRSLEERQIPINGKIVGLIGNVKAYEVGKRFINYDLNRCWTDQNLSYLKSNPPGATLLAEDFEFLELHEEIQKHDDDRYKRKIFVDLHATSSENGNFIVISDQEANDEVVKALKLPIVVNLEKYLAGTLLEFMHKRGFTSFAFEGGLIGSDRALSLHTSGIWELLYASGIVKRLNTEEFLKYEMIIDSFIHHLPHKVSVLYRHEVKEDDKFKMKPGYKNFQKVKKGEIVARDSGGTIQVKADGLIFMPLYQERGKDGFFIVQELEPQI